MYLIKIPLIVFSMSCMVACATKVPLTEQALAPVRVEQPAARIYSALPSKANEAPAHVISRDVKPIEVVPITVSKSAVLYFDFDSYAIKPEYQALLEMQAKFLAANPKIKIALGGHTDELGGREYNLALGQKRADTIKLALAILGVSEAQMEAVSFGKEKPASAEADEAGRAKNRRVELTTL